MNHTIHLIGIGGAGMSSLTGLLLELGFTNLVGVDISESYATKSLKERGVTIHIGHGTSLPQAGDFLIYSQAAEGCVEVETMIAHHKENHIQTPPPMLYTQFLGEVSKYMKTIAITGTHGKTTTTALFTNAFRDVAPDFGIGILGTKLPDRGNENYALNKEHKTDIYKIFGHIFSRKGPFVEAIMKKYWFVIEACEYNRHFLHYDADYAIITNCEIDHMASYEGEKDYFESFCQFIRRVRYEAYTPEILDEGMRYCQETLDPENTKKIHLVPTKQFSFDHLLGGHNNINASLAQALIKDLYPSSNTIEAFESFKGISRRAEHIGENTHGIPVLSDYGHHPTEIASTLHALKEKYPDKVITAIFQPHQISRIAEFWEEFKEALLLAETRILTPIFAAREEFSDIQNLYPKKEHLHSVDTLSQYNHLTAEHFDATLVKDSKVIHHINTIEKGMIVLFTAGSLDRTVRSSL